MAVFRSLTACAFCFLLILCGCANPVSHPWQALGSDRAVVVPTDSWRQLIKDEYSAVTPDRFVDAVEMLKDRSFNSLTQDQATTLTGKTTPPHDERLKPYLVRGVAFGGIPCIQVVRFDEKTGWLVVHHGTWNGENMITAYAARRALPLPLVVWLPRIPEGVFPTAEVGGDWIMRGRGAAELCGAR